MRRMKEGGTCSSRPLVSSHVGSVFGVNLAVLGGADVQAAVPLDGDLVTEWRFRHLMVNTLNGRSRRRCKIDLIPQ